MNYNPLKAGKKLKDIDSKAEMAKVLFNVLFAVIGALGLYTLNQMSGSIGRVEKSVAALNINMAKSQVITDLVQTSVDDHETRIRALEQSFQHKKRD